MIHDKLKELDTLIANDPAPLRVAALAAEIRAMCSTEADRAEVEAYLDSRLAKLNADIDHLRAEAARLRLGEIAEMVNLSYIARAYFHKSRSWLSQRINGNKVNGKPCRFTDQELRIFNEAVRDMGARLSTASIHY